MTEPGEALDALRQRWGNRLTTEAEQAFEEGFDAAESRLIAAERRAEEAVREAKVQREMGDERSRNRLEEDLEKAEREADAAWKERTKMKADRDRLAAALREIRDADYRGNQHPSAATARRALDAP